MKSIRLPAALAAATAACLLAGCANAATPAAAKKPSRPNVVVIFCDDLGYTDVGCFGAKGFATPNLDRMAKEGMRFTNFYAAQAVCSASRAGILTGCYPNRVGITGALMPNSPIGLAPTEKTIAALVKPAGYATGMVGKWHLGDKPQWMPWNHGFDDYFGLPYSNDMWPVDYDGKPRKASYPALKLYDQQAQVDTIDTLAKQDQLTTRYTEHATQFIRQHKDGPFFLYFAHSMPHVPLGVSEKFRGKSQQGMYGDVIMEIDWSVGEVLKTLKECGLDENTLVVFTSDNGPWLNFGNHGGSCYGLREGKGCSFEGGQKEPCIMRWPGKIAAGTECKKLASTIDLLPTIAGLTEAKLPERKIDGVDIRPLLLGQPDACPRREFLYYYNANDLEAVRRDNWKLVFAHNHRSYVGVKPGMDGHAGPYANGKATYALYDLTADPGETTDVKDAHPEIIAELEKLAAATRQDLGDGLTKTPGTGRRQPGRMESKK
jgi:arylsulfatase